MCLQHRCSKIVVQKTWQAITDVCDRATYSHPSRSIYDWTLGLNLTDGNALELPDDLFIQLKIEKLCDKVTRTLFRNPLDPLGVLPEMQYRELEASISENLTGEIVTS